MCVLAPFVWAFIADGASVQILYHVYMSSIFLNIIRIHAHILIPHHMYPKTRYIAKIRALFCGYISIRSPNTCMKIEGSCSSALQKSFRGREPVARRFLNNRNLATRRTNNKSSYSAPQHAMSWSTNDFFTVVKLQIVFLVCVSLLAATAHGKQIHKVLLIRICIIR